MELEEGIKKTWDLVQDGLMTGCISSLFRDTRTGAGLNHGMKALAMLVLASALLLSRAHGQSNVAEQYLLSAANAERAAVGRSPLAWDATLATAALEHAREMAAHGDISHQFAGEPDLRLPRRPGQAPASP